MVEYGEPVLDINSRVRIHLLEEFLTLHRPPGLIDTTPGVRTLLLNYDNRILSLEELMKLLVHAEAKLLHVESVKLKSRIFELPIAFRDQWTRAAIDRYMSTIRAEASYLPDNLEFIGRNNGISGKHCETVGELSEVEKVISSASYLVLGLGDVYLGAPCAVPLDPRHRLSVPKYNPARTFTPEGAVGIGGMYMCIYPMESPGGYQLVGRTLPIWNTFGNLPNFGPVKPWLLDMFDQVRFYPVSEQDLSLLRQDFSEGKMKLDLKVEDLCMKSYNQFLKSVEEETGQVKKKQLEAQNLIFQAEALSLRDSVHAKQEALKVLNYLATMVVDGPDHPGAVGPAPSKTLAKIPISLPEFPPGHVNSSRAPPRGLKHVFDEKGPKGFVEAVLASKGTLLTDTTWRDAHQSLLMTRMRTIDMKNIAHATAHTMASAFSLEMWGGATFDVSLRFLHECPWDRLAELRELVPNIPFQMLFRGANAVGYSAYPDNVIYKFCKQAKETGMDVFRIFDSLNYLENMRLGIDAVGEAGGIVEATICYTGDITNPKKTKYNLDYYLNLARDLEKLGIHVLCVKDMAGLLKPSAATILISALRKEFPNLPIHVHTHDTAGTAVATLLACVQAGANAVDCCNDALSGLTSQGSMGAIISDLENLEKNTGVALENYQQLTTYWEGVRRLYGPFESGQKSAGADVYVNEIPGGQYTNLFFQALSMGMAEEWEQIKTAYANANLVLGDIVKVTPSSKVVGDLASYMVANKLDLKSVQERAADLNFPNSVVEFLQGYLGQPHGGFPEPFRSHVLKDKPRIEGRPGKDLPPLDFTKKKLELQSKFGIPLRDVDVMSSVQFPAVFEDYVHHSKQFGNVSVLPTRQFLEPMQIGEKVSFTCLRKNFNVVLDEVKDNVGEAGTSRVMFDINGEKHVISVKAKDSSRPSYLLRTGGPVVEKPTGPTRKKADPGKVGSVGASIPGRVVDVKFNVGSMVEKGQVVIVLSSMKLELAESATISGKLISVDVTKGDFVSVGDLLFEIQ
eukprot:TRINITY_DN1994_c0_g1_i2.p1 TRINITY_DN1994_c0_g1~~TRINITY_DN1994_c0_g1_i2.p1  ORF type:complete len:1021 (-),score=266.22 TRINITY_DN1994_c0_g1_i2:158-3220(-)